jgi:co-chaperonin GroES (HSP10)
MELRPRNGFVVVKLLEEDEGRGRIIVPSGVAPFPMRGIVLYVDEGYRRVDGFEMDLQPGDEVLFFKEQVTELRLEDETVSLIHETYVIAVTDPAVIRRGPS